MCRIHSTADFRITPPPAAALNPFVRGGRGTDPEPQTSNPKPSTINPLALALRAGSLWGVGGGVLVTPLATLLLSLTPHHTLEYGPFIESLFA